jgi:hypothetical protein
VAGLMRAAGLRIQGLMKRSGLDRRERGRRFWKGSWHVFRAADGGLVIGGAHSRARSCGAVRRAAKRCTGRSM